MGHMIRGMHELTEDNPNVAQGLGDPIGDRRLSWTNRKRADRPNSCVSMDGGIDRKFAADAQPLHGMRS